MLGSAFFAHHAASSHTACGVMGVVIAAWIRGFSFVFPSLCPGERPLPSATAAGSNSIDFDKLTAKKPQAVMVQPADRHSRSSSNAGVSGSSSSGASGASGASEVTGSRFLSMAIIMHFLFALGCFLWFRFCIAPTVAMYGMAMAMSSAEALVLTSTHIVAFTLGMVVHSDFHRRKFYERSEVEIMQYYSIAYAIFVTVPRVAGAVFDSVGLGMLYVMLYVVSSALY